MHERQIIDSAFTAAGKSAEPILEFDLIVNLAFHTMNGGLATVIPDHFAHVIGAFPKTRVIRLIEPEVVREVGLVWIEGDRMLPMAKAMHSLLKSMSESGELERILRQPKLAAAEQR